MNRRLQVAVTTIFAFCSTLSCSDHSASNIAGMAATDSTGITLTDSTAAEARIASASVTLAQNPIEVGQTTQATALLVDYQSRPISLSVTWSSSDTSVAKVSGTGVVRAQSPGVAGIIATRGGKSGVAPLTVTGAVTTSVKPGTVADLQASAIGSTSVTLSFTQVNDGSGQPAKYDIRYAVAPISWGSATSTTTGTCATPVAGTAIGSQFSCTVLGLTPATNYNFQLVAFRGTLNLSAVFGSISSIVSAATTASAPPPPAPVASVSVSPASSNLLIGATVQLQVTARDANDSVLTGRIVTSSSADPGVASVNSLGLVTAIGPGTTQITVTSEGKSAIATIIVSAAAPVPVASVTVSPAASSLLVGATVQLSAVTRDASNNVLTGRVTTWSSSNTSISTVSASGLVRAIAAGSATITATSETKTGTAAITVSAPAPVPVASVTVSPATPSLTVGGTVQFSAVTRDANNNILTGRSITWSSNNVAVATVSASALGTAVAVGSAQITATSEGKVGSATLTATAPPPPPPPGSSNEPAGMTILTDRPFNTTGEGWTDWWPGGLMTFVSDATAPHSPSGILRATYPTGYVAGSAPGAWDPPMSGNKKTVYLAVWVKHSANWFGQSTGTNKIFYFHTSTNDAPVFYFTAEGVGNADLVPYIALQATVSPGESNLGPNLVPSARMARGQWNLIEVIAVGNSAGNRDGSIDWFLNGVHVGSYAVEFESGGTTWQRLSLAPVWGGQGGSVPATQTLDFDHAYISVK